MSLKAIVSPNALSKRKAAAITSKTTTTTTATILNLSKVFAFRALVLPLTDLSGFFIPTTSKSITAHTRKSIRSYIHAKTKQTKTRSQMHNLSFVNAESLRWRNRKQSDDQTKRTFPLLHQIKL